MHYHGRIIDTSPTLSLLWLLVHYSWNGNIFLVTGPLPVTGEFPSQRPVTRSFGVFFDERLEKQLSKQSRRRWYGTPSHSLWRHSNLRWPLTTVMFRQGTEPLTTSLVICEASHRSAMNSKNATNTELWCLLINRGITGDMHEPKTSQFCWVQCPPD